MHYVRVVREGLSRRWQLSWGQKDERAQPWEEQGQDSKQRGQHGPRPWMRTLLMTSGLEHSEQGELSGSDRKRAEIPCRSCGLVLGVWVNSSAQWGAMAEFKRDVVGLTHSHQITKDWQAGRPNQRLSLCLCHAGIMGPFSEEETKSEKAGDLFQLTPVRGTSAQAHVPLCT